MRTLHVAAMPFPSEQGTQALVHAITSALAQAGHDTHLLCYPHAGFERAASYTLHRGADVARDRSVRSGPSLRKLVQDAQLARDLRQLYAALRPAHVIAHHVEAAWAARAAGLSDVTFIAHTSLSGELGSYFHDVWNPLCTRLGAGIDKRTAQLAARRFAISPDLRTRLSTETECSFELLTPPWSTQPELGNDERHSARAQLGLDQAAEVVIYAGNLDAYQGLDTLCAGLGPAMAQRPQLRWLVATDSNPLAFLAHLPPTISARTRCVALRGDAVRRLVHAAADLALVPRKSPGGLPIKLLDALAHGVPVLACERATAGFEFGRACRLIDNDAATAWAPAIARFFALSQQHRRAFADHARAVVRGQHDPTQCVNQLLSAASAGPR